MLPHMSHTVWLFIHSERGWLSEVDGVDLSCPQGKGKESFGDEAPRVLMPHKFSETKLQETYNPLRSRVLGMSPGVLMPH